MDGLQLKVMSLGMDLPEIKNEGWTLLLFKSTFCSRCFITRKMIEEYSSIKLLEIDIANPYFKNLNIYISSVPYLVLLNNNKVWFLKEGMISRLEMEKMIKIKEFV